MLELGYMARDKMTGFTGVVEYRTTYIYGCDRYSLQPLVKDGEYKEGYVFDEPQIEIIPDLERIVEPQPAPEQLIPLGSKIRDKLLGTEGVAFGRTVYLNGCSRICLRRIMTKDGTIHNEWIDEEGLEIIEQPKQSVVDKPRTGGPGLNASWKSPDAKR